MASKKILTPYDFTQNEIQNAVTQNLATAPTGPKPGQFYFDTTSGKWLYRDLSSNWVDPTNRTFHTGTQLAATISDFSATVRQTRLDQLAAPTADVSHGGYKATNLADGTAATDAATFGQLSAVLNGRDFKDSVRVATTASVAQTSLTAIDGITLVDGDRILDKDNSDATKRGIWVAHSGAWTRATDADTSVKLTANMTVMVEEGTANADQQFTLTTNQPITLGTTNLTFAKTGAGTSYTAGGGIIINGSTIAIDTAVVARKGAATITGDGFSTSFNVNHGLNTNDVMVEAYDFTTKETVEISYYRQSTGVLNVTFAQAPANGAAYRVVVVG